MPTSPLPFRTGTVLATTFTGTLSERLGTPVERIPTTQRLVDWFQANGLDVRSCSEDELDIARELREAIHEAAMAAATGTDLPESAVGILNVHAQGGHAAAQLDADGTRQWHLGDAAVADALRVIATDAIELVAGERDGRVAQCASPTCRAVFLDTSQSRTRRWCDMNSCGNRDKKARFNSRRAASAS